MQMPDCSWLPAPYSIQSRRNYVVAAFALVLVPWRPALLHAQTGNIPVGVDTSMVGIYVSVASPSTCSDNSPNVSSGAFVKSGTVVHIDAEATAVGVCQFWYSGIHYPQYDYQRYVGSMHGHYTLPNSSVQPLNFYAPYPYSSHDYDTRNPNGGNSYNQQTPTINGRYAIDLTGYAANFPSNCSASSVSATMLQSFNVTSCTPRWFRPGNPPTYTVHVPAQTIHIFVPATDNLTSLTTFNQDGPLDLAVADWNTALSSTGVSFEVVFDESQCGTGGNCILVGETLDKTEAEDGLTGCAGTTRGSVDSVTGEMLSPAQLNLNDLMWGSASAERLHRTLSHELGHSVGLFDFDNSCNDTQSVMSPLTVTTDTFANRFTACTTLSSVNTVISPTLNDILPTTSSTYGNHSQLTCGF